MELNSLARWKYYQPTTYKVCCITLIIGYINNLIHFYFYAGEEFCAVFLSTCEPTDHEGRPQDLVKSICNEYVFNTVVTRAQSLVFSAGNPFLLQQMGTHFKTNCWAEYIQRCIQCQSLVTPDVLSEEELERLPEQVRLLSAKVFPTEALSQATSLDQEMKPFCFPVFDNLASYTW